MIYAKLDVCFWRHKKFRRAGVAASGYWAAALAYLREDDSDDGFLPSDVVGQLLGVTEAEGQELCRKLVEVGLFQACDGGYLLLGYTTKNESRSQIEARKAANARKVAAWRTKSRGGNEPVTGDVTIDVTGHSDQSVTSGRGAVTASDVAAVTSSSCTGPGSALRWGSGASEPANDGAAERLADGSARVTTAAFPMKNRGSAAVDGDAIASSNRNVTRGHMPVTESGVTAVTLPPCTGSGSGSGSDSDSDSDSDLRSGSDAREEPDEATTPRLAGGPDTPTTGHGLMGMQVDAYGEGISAVTGVPYVKSGPFEAKMLEDCAKRAGGLTGQALLAWYREKAEKFARSVNPRFGYSAHRFVAWLNGGERTDSQGPAAPPSAASTRDLSRPESRNLNNLGAGLPPLPPLRPVTISRGVTAEDLGVTQ